MLLAYRHMKNNNWSVRPSELPTRHTYIWHIVVSLNFCELDIFDAEHPFWALRSQRCSHSFA